MNTVTREDDQAPNDLRRCGLLIVEQGALLLKPTPPLCLLLLTELQRTLNVALFLGRLLPRWRGSLLFRLLLLLLLVALADTPAGHAIVHILSPTAGLGETLVIGEKTGKFASAYAHILTNIAARVVNVLKLREGLDYVNVVTEILRDFW